MAYLNTTLLLVFVNRFLPSLVFLVFPINAAFPLGRESLFWGVTPVSGLGPITPLSLINESVPFIVKLAVSAI